MFIQTILVIFFKRVTTHDIFSTFVPNLRKRKSGFLTNIAKCVLMNIAVVGVLIGSEKVAIQIGVSGKKATSIKSFITKLVENIGDVLVHEEGVIGVSVLVFGAVIAEAERIEDVLLARLAFGLFAIHQDGGIRATVEANRMI